MIDPVPTDEYAKPLVPEKLLAEFALDSPARAPRVAVIGAGISGLIAARTLLEHGWEVVVFEKSRGVGGRAATRRADPGLSFDHGAQYFTARDPHFARQVETWIEQGSVAEWTGRIVEIERSEVRPKLDQPRRFVGVPGMTAVARMLAVNVPLRSETRIARLSRADRHWDLTDTAGQTHSPFDYVIVSLPAPQSADLLDDHSFAAEARAVPMTPCWAVMAAFEWPIEVAWDGAFVQSSPIAWTARNSSKPGRDSYRDCWVMQASPDWSVAQLDRPRNEVSAALLAEFAAITGRPTPATVYLDAHRWLYSATPLSLERLFLFDTDTGLAVCGDWLAGGRIEGAFRSGVATAHRLLGKVDLPSAATSLASPRSPEA